MHPLHVAELGPADAPAAPVVLLHSGGMSGRQWRRLAERLAARQRVILPDFTGSGDSPPWPDGAPFHFHADADAVAAHLAGRGPVHLVGHSYGGLVALTLARRDPGLARSIAVYDPVAFGVLRDARDADALADLEAVARDNPAFWDEATGGDEAWLRAFIDYWNGPGSWLSLPPPARAAFLRVGRKVFLEVRSLAADETTRAGYAAITAPTLLLGGARSPLAARRVIELLGAALPRARVESLDGAGHMGPITHGAQVNDAIVAHIDAQTDPPA